MYDPSGQNSGGGGFSWGGGLNGLNTGMGGANPNIGGGQDGGFSWGGFAGNMLDGSNDPTGMASKFGLGPMMGGLFGTGGSGSGNQDPGMGYLNQIAPMLHQEYDPWINNGMAQAGALNGYVQQGQQAGQDLSYYNNMGQKAGNSLYPQLNNMVNNPSGVMNNIGSTFQQSPGYQWQVNQSLGAANRAAAAGGMAGSMAEQQNIADTTGQLANQDYYNYLNHGLGVYNQGIQGLQNMYGTGVGTAEDQYNTGAQVGTNMYDTGATMANELAQNLGATYMNQGNMSRTDWLNAQQKQQGQQGAMGGMLGSMGGMFGGGGGSGGGDGSSGGGSGMNMQDMMGLASMAMMFM